MAKDYDMHPALIVSCFARLGISIGIAVAMGHTIEVHLKSYARFKPNATADLVAAVNV